MGPIPFDAGSIISTLDVRLTPWQQGLEQAKKEGVEFAKQRYRATLDADPKALDTALRKARSDLSGFGRERYTAALGVSLNTADLKAVDAQLAAATSKRRDLQMRATLDGGGAVQAQLAALKQAADRVDGRTISMRAVLDGAPLVLSEAAAIDQGMSRLDGQTARMRAELDGGAELAARLAQVEAQASAADGRTVRVNADSGQLTTMIAKFVLLGSVAAAAGVAASGALAGIGAGAALIAPGLGAAVLGFSGVSEAVKAVTTQQKEAGKAATDTGAKAAAAADAQASAAASLVSAERGLANARASAAEGAARAARAVDQAREQSRKGVERAIEQEKDAERSLSDAIRARGKAREQVDRVTEAAAERVSQAVAQAATAERTYQRAVKDSRTAQLAINDARTEAKRGLEDLQFQVLGGALAEQRAVIQLEKAQEDLNAARAAGVTGRDLREVALSYEEAKLSLDQLRVSNGRLTQEKAAGDKAGVEGSKQVVAAQDRAAQAAEAVRDADIARGKAAADVTRAQVEGQRQINDARERVAEADERVSRAQEARDRAAAAIGEARRDGIEKVREALIAEQAQQRQSAASIQSALEGVESAQRQVAAAARRQAEATTGGADAVDKAAEAMAKLSPAGQEFVRFLVGLQGKWDNLKKTAQEGLLPGVQDGIEALLTREPEINAFVGKYSKAMGDLAKRTGEGLASERWTSFFNWLGDQAGPSIELFGSITGNIFGGIAGVIRGASPLWYEIGRAIEAGTKKFQAWGDEVAAGKNEGFNRFLGYVREYGPRVWATIVDIAKAGAHVVEALLPLGGILVDVAGGAARFIDSLPPGVIKAVAIGLAAIVVSFKALKAIGKVSDLFSNVPGFGRRKLKGEVTLARGQTVKLAKGECVKLCKGECSCDDDGPDGRGKKGKDGGPAPAPAPAGKKGGKLRGFAKGVGLASGAGLAGILGGYGLNSLLPGEVPDKLKYAGPGTTAASRQVGAVGTGLIGNANIFNGAVDWATGADDGQRLQKGRGQAAQGIGLGIGNIMGEYAKIRDGVSKWWDDYRMMVGEKAYTAYDTVLSWFDERGLKGWISRKYDEISTNISTWWDNFKTTTGEKAFAVYDTVMSWFDERGLKGWITRKYEEISTNISVWWDNFKATTGQKAFAVYDTVMSWFDERGLKGWISRKYDEISTNISLWWDNFKTTAGQKAFAVYDTVMSWFDERGLKGWMQRKYDEIALNISLWWDNFKTTVGAKAFAVYDTIMSWFDERGLKGWLQRKYDEIAVNLSLWWDNFKATAGAKAFAVYDTIMSWFDERGLKGWLQRKYDEIAANLSLWWDNFKATMGTKAYQTYDLIMSWFDERGLKGWLARKFEDIKVNAGQKWEELKGVVVGKAIGVYNDVTGWFGRLGGWLGGFWQNVTDTAGRIWGQIKAKTAEPINFVIQEVYGKHIRGVWGAIQGWIPGLPNLAAPGPPIRYAQGGFHEDHRAQITSPGGPTRIWSEPETGGEAYIPMGSAKRERSTGILAQVADRFGLSIARKDTGMLQQYADGGITRVAFGPSLEFADGGLIAFGRRLQGMGYDVAEHPAFGGVGDHGKTSLHYSGNAIDVNKGAGTSPAEQQALGRIVPMAREYGLRTIFMSPGHYNHAHFDTGQGADIRDGDGGGGLFGMFDPVQMLKDRFKDAVGAISGLDRFGNGPFIQAAKGIPGTIIDSLVNFAKDKVPFLGGGMMGATSNEAPGIVKIIADAARMRGFGREGAVIGTATGLVESGLRNLPGGDRDSVGVFQQRPSMGWGTIEQCMNVMYAATKFFSRFPGNWRSMPPGDVAQGVQRSAFGYKYATRMAEAAGLVGQHGGAFDNGGPWLPGTFGFNGSGEVENVLTDRQGDALEDRIRGDNAPAGADLLAALAEMTDRIESAVAAARGITVYGAQGQSEESIAEITVRRDRRAAQSVKI